MTSAYDWSGSIGDVWAQEWRRTDRSLAGLQHRLDAVLVDRLPDRGRILDIGCGAGTTTRAVATLRLGATVTGIDLSAALVAVARARHADVGGVDFVAGDALTVAAALAPVEGFVSRHGVMFFADPPAAFSRLRAAASPGAVLLFSCFSDPRHNPWSADLVAAVTGTTPADAPAGGYRPGPFAFADKGFVGRVLDNAGWSADEPIVADFDYVAGEGDDPVADAASFLQWIGPAASALRAMPVAGAAEARVRLVRQLARYRRDNRVVFPASAWIWTARNDRAGGL